MRVDHREIATATSEAGTPRWFMMAPKLGRFLRRVVGGLALGWVVAGLAVWDGGGADEEVSSAFPASRWLDRRRSAWRCVMTASFQVSPGGPQGVASGAS